jgi:hypothetical protein
MNPIFPDICKRLFLFSRVFDPKLGVVEMPSSFRLRSPYCLMANSITLLVSQELTNLPRVHLIRIVWDNTFIFWHVLGLANQQIN